MLENWTFCRPMSYLYLHASRKESLSFSYYNLFNFYSAVDSQDRTHDS
jgi:hypothetical protein